MERILHIIEYTIWVLYVLATAYLLFFTLASLFKRKLCYPQTQRKKRFVVLFPAYREDKIIEQSVSTFLAQNYPKNCYDIVVISDHMEDTTNERLSQLPLILLKAGYANSSKAKALNFAIDQLNDRSYDIVVIMDADNTTDIDFLQQLNNVFDTGVLAVQTHRTAKNRDTGIAALDAASEEINNSIFRKGHVRIGLSSALIGSGMAFNYQWFKENIRKVSGAGEDKELETLLLKQRIYIEYVENVFVYDEKIQGERNFYNQRRRWLAAQYSQWIQIIKDLPGAIITCNIDYCDKLLQWLMPSRLLLIGSCGLIAFMLFITKWEWSLKWWGLFVILFVTLRLAIPNKLIDKQFRKAIYKLPILFILMVLNLFRIRGVNKKFIHTEHKEISGPIN